MTDLEKVLEHLVSCGFEGTINEEECLEGFLYATIPLVVSHQKDAEGNHYLIRGITVVNYNGANTKKGKIGCLCFYYSGVKRKKYMKNCYTAEILKKAGCYKTEAEAIKEFDMWIKETKDIRNGWKKII